MKQLEIWSSNDKRVQTSPALAEAKYNPYLTKAECSKLQNGVCPLVKNDINEYSECICKKIAEALINDSDELKNVEVELYYDSDKDEVIFKHGALITCVYNKISKENPEVKLTTIVNNSKFNTSLEYDETSFGFMDEQVNHQIGMNQGKMMLHYDSTFELDNSEDANVTEYAYCFEAFVPTENYPKDVKKSRKIFFTNESSIWNVYDLIHEKYANHAICVLKKISENMFPREPYIEVIK